MRRRWERFEKATERALPAAHVQLMERSLDCSTVTASLILILRTTVAFEIDAGNTLWTIGV